ncbi:MAG: hypothetical protein H7Y04_04875 [Verrucomicrobia bacterium]|nr:hypothetical protein [Cytophagales bacterium]
MPFQKVPTIIIFIFFLSQLVHGQEFKSIPRKGKFYFQWGYSREKYSKSDIRFTGPGYDFTAKKAIARDDPEKFTLDKYFNPVKLTIPQFDLRIGYFLSERYSLSVGWDHLKYVVFDNQNVLINGYIDKNQYPAYGGIFKDTLVNFGYYSHYELTDGANFARINLDRYQTVWKSRNKKSYLDLIAGAGIGVLIPNPTIRILDKRLPNKFMWGGFGVAVNAAIRFSFWKHFYLQAEVKGGYLDFLRVRTNSKNRADKATQTFSYAQASIQAGGYFRIGKK